MMPTAATPTSGRWLLADVVFTRKQGKLVPIPRAKVTVTYKGEPVVLFKTKTGAATHANPLRVGPTGLVHYYILGSLPYVDLVEETPTGEIWSGRINRP